MSKKASKPKTPKTKKAAKAAPAAKAERDQRNGITRPGADTKTGAVWAALDALKAEGKEITFEALRAAIDSKIADATIRTQRQRWNQFSG